MKPDAYCRYKPRTEAICAVPLQPPAAPSPSPLRSREPLPGATQQGGGRGGGSEGPRGPQGLYLWLDKGYQTRNSESLFLWSTKD